MTDDGQRHNPKNCLRSNDNRHTLPRSSGIDPRETCSNGIAKCLEAQITSETRTNTVGVDSGHRQTLPDEVFTLIVVVPQADT